MPARHRPLADVFARVSCLFCRDTFGSLARFASHLCLDHPALDVNLYGEA